jgi:hypothetical protein
MRLALALAVLASLPATSFAAREKGEPEDRPAPAKIVVVRSLVDGRAVRKVYQVKPLVDAEGKIVPQPAVSR